MEYVNGKLTVIKSSLSIYLEREEVKREVKEKSKKWSPEETEKFYKALQIFGTDFSILMKLLPGRSRKQIKNKFNKEERVNPERIDATLKQAGSYTLEDFEKYYGKVNSLANEEDQFIKEKMNFQAKCDKEDLCKANS